MIRSESTMNTDKQVIFQMSDFELIDWVSKNGLFMVYLYALHNNGLI